jgi:TPR repeat protein
MGFMYSVPPTTFAIIFLLSLVGGVLWVVFGQKSANTIDELPQRTIDAAIEGDRVEQFNLGLSYALGDGVSQSYREAEKWYRRSAEKGFARAQYNLGVMYDYGEGVPQDYVAAVKWYRLAADQGHPGSERNLGMMYCSGKGVKLSFEEAAKWLEKAATQGDPFAQNNLGLLYRDGTGVPLDYVRAHAWHSLAASLLPGDQGTLARENRDVLAAKMTAEQVKSGPSLGPDRIRIEV